SRCPKPSVTATRNSSSRERTVPTKGGCHEKTDDDRGRARGDERRAAAARRDADVVRLPRGDQWWLTGAADRVPQRAALRDGERRLRGRRRSLRRRRVPHRQPVLAPARRLLVSLRELAWSVGRGGRASRARARARGAVASLEAPPAL